MGKELRRIQSCFTSQQMRSWKRAPGILFGRQMGDSRAQCLQESWSCLSSVFLSGFHRSKWYQNITSVQCIYILNVSIFTIKILFLITEWLFCTHLFLFHSFWHTRGYVFQSLLPGSQVLPIQVSHPGRLEEGNFVGGPCWRLHYHASLGEMASLVCCVFCFH